MLRRWLALGAWVLGCLSSAVAAAPPACPPDNFERELAKAPAPARDRGLLWRLHKDGRTSYLYGTIHLGRVDWRPPGPQVAAALRGSDTLALELDLDAPEMQPRLVEALKALPPLELPPALRQRLEQLKAALCVPSGAWDGLHPLLQATGLALLAAHSEGLHAQLALEKVLAEAARASQLDVVSLETPQAQLNALVPSAPAPARRLVERLLAQIESPQLRPSMARLARSWANGDLADLENYPQWCDCSGTPEERELLQRLNDERNPAMAERIDALHRSGLRVFAAVGALHMTGAQALPKLMAQRGYRVERVAFAR